VNRDFIAARTARAAAGGPVAVGIATLAAALLLLGCSSAPPPPDWQMNAKGSLERATAAYLAGNSRVEAVEFARARADLARTGRADLVARAELTRCALRVASLEFDDCPGFTALAADAAPAERAYAAYLLGQASAQDAALLPEPHREPAKASGSSEAVRRIEDPLARLVAAGVLLRSRRAEPALFALASDTASAQGWSRPLLAWLGAQVQRAEAAGESNEAARLRRRIGLVLAAPAGAAAASVAK
jgi:hypothetical protein